MFYSRHLKEISTNSSYLNPEQVFSGNYWDEFGLSSYLVPDSGQVLMLGLSLGGGIRPMLASTKKISLTCIDLDEKAINKCRSIFKDNFSNLIFESHVADALTFLNDIDKSFDLIWLDIYDQKSYCNICFDLDFLEKIRSKLTPEGVLAVNAYGIPSQFQPLQQPSAQKELAHRLQKVFAFVGTLPFRRNQTFIACKEKPFFHDAQPHPSLSGLDKKSMSVLKARIKNLVPLERIESDVIDLQQVCDFEFIDQEMRKGWQTVTKKLRSYGISIDHAQELLNLIQDEYLCSKILDRALTEKDEFVSFIAVLCAGESQIQNLNIEWIFNWTHKNSGRMAQTFPLMSSQVWLPQLWALAISPSKKYRMFSFQAYQLIQENL